MLCVHLCVVLLYICVYLREYVQRYALVTKQRPEEDVGRLPYCMCDMCTRVCVHSRVYMRRYALMRLSRGQKRVLSVFPTVYVVHAHMCALESESVRTEECTHVTKQRPEEDVGCLPYCSPPYFLR